MSLPQTPEYQVFVDDLENKFDFTESKVVQPVYSCAGSYQGRYELDCGGGFDSLAKAVKAFEPDYRGAWNIEYIVRLRMSSSHEQSLRRLILESRLLSFRLLSRSRSQTGSSSSSSPRLKELLHSNSSNKKPNPRRKRRNRSNERKSSLGIRPSRVLRMLSEAIS